MERWRNFLDSKEHFRIEKTLKGQNAKHAAVAFTIPFHGENNGGCEATKSQQIAS